MEKIDLIIDEINSSNNYQLFINKIYDSNISLILKKQIINNVDDYIKINVLDLIDDKIYLKLIISSLHNDSDKLKYIYLLDDYDKFEIISFFNTDKEKIKSINMFEDSYWKDLIFYSLKDHDIRKNSLKLITDDNIKLNIISEYSFEEKIKCLVYIKDIELREKFLLKLLNIKNEKITNINSLNNEYVNIISLVYDINNDRLTKLINKFSLKILLYFDSDISLLLKYDNEDFNKFLDMFDESNLTLSRDELENICYLVEYYKYDLENKDAYKMLINYLNNSDSVNFMNLYNHILECLNREELYKIIKYNELNINDIKYLMHNLFNKNDFFKNLNILKIITNIYNDKNRNDFIGKNIQDIKNNIGIINKITSEDLLNIAISFDYEKIQTLINNEDVYNSLLKILFKYKYLAIKDSISNIFELVNLNYGTSIIKNIIENFEEFYKIVNEKDDNKFIDIIYLANGYEKVNYDKLLLLGINNYYLMKNKTLSLNEIKNNIITLYNKKKASIPSFSMNIDIKDTNIDIITNCYFDKNNYLEEYRENDFNILFKDTKTNNVICKLNGFRNNNLLFLDEFNIYEKINLNNDDYILLLEKVCDKIIDISNKNNDNIENIFISIYNYSHLADEEIVPYVNSKYILYKGSSIITINIESKEKSYKVLRNKIELYENENAKKRIVELELLNSILNGNNEYKEELLDNIEYCYSGEDWYICKYKNDGFHTFILDKSKDDKNAIEEKNICMDILKNS